MPGLLVDFSNKLMEGNFTAIRKLLHPDGEFSCYDPIKQETVNNVSRNRLVKYLKNARERYIINVQEFEKFQISICNGCSNKGCQIVWFDDGIFPYGRPLFSGLFRGLAIEEKDGLIFELFTCFRFEAIEQVEIMSLLSIWHEDADNNEVVIELRKKYTPKELEHMLTLMNKDFDQQTTEEEKDAQNKKEMEEIRQYKFELELTNQQLDLFSNTENNDLPHP